ncbi:CoA transferase [Pelagibacterium limicola]|uniref:CoA transferase n=1 Tax=Pelagibacterium limicola TaxID=2791022 RepID=UPI0018AF8AF1|nr:CoA transferase [Pelagibacterium limicola]
MNLLEGIRVLEIADGLTDFGGRMLSEMGADVVSVSVSGSRPEADIAIHHGKTRINADSRDAIVALARQADIVLDGQRLGDKFGLAEALSGNPETIHVLVTPFSSEGPYARRPATDLTLFALSGLMHVTGDPQSPPLKFPGRQAYVLTGIQAATAALLALYARRATGHGQQASLSAFQSATLANYREAVMYEWTGRIGRRQGNMLVRGKSGVRQIWPCKDGHVTWSMIDNPSMMRALVSVMADQGCSGELSDIDWDNTLVADTPQETIERWQAIVGAFFAENTRQQLGAWSLEKGWGLSVIAEPRDVRESEHLKVRGLFVPVTDEQTGKVINLPGPMFHCDAMDGSERVLKAPIPASQFEGWGGR